MIIQSSPDTVRATVLHVVPCRKNITGHIYRCAERKGSTYLRTSAYLNVNENNKSVEVKAVARTNFLLWGPCFVCSAASPVWCVLLACWLRPWLWEWEKSKWLPHDVEMGKWMEHQNHSETLSLINFE